MMKSAPHFKSGDLLPIYALISSESVLVQDAIHKLKETIAPEISETNTEYFHAAEIKMNKLIQTAQTLPFLAKLRFIHVAHIEKLKAKELDGLIQYIESPNPSTLLCFSGSKIDQRTKFGKTLTKHNYLFNMTPPNQKELPRWLIERANLKSTKLDMDAAFLLTDLIGNDLALLERSLEKTILYAHPESRITFEHVQECVAATRLNSVFELTDAVGMRQPENAICLLRKIMANGESGLLVLSMLARHLRQLVRIKTLSSYSLSDYDLAKELGSRHFFMPSLKEQASHFTGPELSNAIQSLSGFDMRLKSSRTPAVFLLQEFILNFMGVNQ